MKIRCCVVMFLLGTIGLNTTVGDDRNRVSDCDTNSEFAKAFANVDCDSLSPETVNACRRPVWKLPPAMIGDFFAGASNSLRSDSVIDRLVVVANDLDAPAVLPATTNVLSIREPGPIGAFDTAVTSIGQLQTLLRNGATVPGFALVGVINQDAELTTLRTIGQIQADLAATSLPLDIIALQVPPANYTAAVASLFAQRNALPGTARFVDADSGALLQGGADTLSGSEDLDAYYFYNYALRLDTAIADSVSGGVGRSKISDGGTVLPTDRLFLRYNNVYGLGGPTQSERLSRFVPGFETTFAGGRMSTEVRAPFAIDASAGGTIGSGDFTNNRDVRFGNLAVYLKALLIGHQRFALSGGLGVICPTASDLRVGFSDGTDLLQVSNDSVHLQPFLGMMYRPNQDWFAHGFVQSDIDTNGDRVQINSGSGLSYAGRLTDADFLHVDFGIGAWMYRSENSRGLTGIVPTVEVHHSQAVNDGDVITSGAVQVGNFQGTIGQTNLVFGSTALFGNSCQISSGYALPLTGNAQYDGALQLMLSIVL